jgi:hypothetical protein
MPTIAIRPLYEGMSCYSFALTETPLLKRLILKASKTGATCAQPLCALCRCGLIIDSLERERKVGEDKVLCPSMENWGKTKKTEEPLVEVLPYVKSRSYLRRGSVLLLEKACDNTA